MNRRQRRTSKRRTRRVGVIVASVTVLAATAGLSGNASAENYIRVLPGQGSHAPVANQDLPDATDEPLDIANERSGGGEGIGKGHAAIKT